MAVHTPIITVLFSQPTSQSKRWGIMVFNSI